MLPLFGFIYSYFAPLYHFGPDLTICINILQYLALFTYIYPHLALFSLIWLYLNQYNCPNLTIYAIFTLHRYYSSETAPLCKILKQSDNHGDITFKIM